MVLERSAIRPDVVWERIESLARHGKHGETGVSRTVYSPEWRAAQDEIADWCDAIGLEVRWDAVGNVWGKLPGTEPGPSIVSGSHIDSQVPGGRFDGVLGVIAAATAIGTLKERYGAPRRSLEIVSLCEEESSRFPTTGFWGSRAIRGAITESDLETVVSFDGEPIGEVMASAGFDPLRVAEARRNDLAAFVEMHIEQGPILEAENLPVGIVSAITGLRHYVVTVDGVSNHAGAFPMDLRLDPMAGAAEMISDVIGRAERIGRPAVTTVGRISAEPNFPAIVPNRVTFMIDARHPDPAARLALYAEHEAAISAIGARRGLKVSCVNIKEHPPYVCDADLVANFEAAAMNLEIPFKTMTSGAVHDTQRMAMLAPGVMIFVRSKDGRSHTPAEYTSPEDAALGIATLTEGLRTLAYE
jgi:allantoate deiminase